MTESNPFATLDRALPSWFRFGGIVFVVFGVVFAGVMFYAHVVAGMPMMTRSGPAPEAMRWFGVLVGAIPVLIGIALYRHARTLEKRIESAERPKVSTLRQNELRRRE